MKVIPNYRVQMLGSVLTLEENTIYDAEPATNQPDFEAKKLYFVNEILCTLGDEVSEVRVNGEYAVLNEQYCSPLLNENTVQGSWYAVEERHKSYHFSWLSKGERYPAHYEALTCNDAWAKMLEDVQKYPNDISEISFTGVTE